MIYQPMKEKFFTQSATTNELIKRKRILLNFGGKMEEWLQLADDFLADGGRANHAFCMAEFRRMGGDTTPVQFDYVPDEPEVPETIDYTDY